MNCDKIEKQPADFFRSKVLSWVKSLYVPPEKRRPGEGMYRYASSSPSPDLYGTCFGLMIRILLRDEISVEERREFIDVLLGYQDKALPSMDRNAYPVDKDTGKFLDPLAEQRDTDSHTWRYISNEMTNTCLMALSHLDVEPRIQPGGTGVNFNNPDTLIKWFDNLEWVKTKGGERTEMAWSLGNEIMNVGGILIKNVEMGKAKQGVVDALFEWLDENVDPETGYWGTDRGCSLFNAMGGAMHMFMLYFYTNRPLRFPEKIVDSTLSLQHKDGLFEVLGGGSQCADFDGVMPLSACYRLYDYRRADIEKALQRVIKSLIDFQLQNEDGGWKSRAGETRRYRRNSLPYVGCEGWESDVLSTYFRCGALALCSIVVKDSPFSHLDWNLTRKHTYNCWVPDL